MAFYYSLKKSDAVDNRIAERLLDLKDGIKKSIPGRTVEKTLLMATWNIREFDGSRGHECLFYIAEIISSFDMVAIQEVREDLTSLDTVMDILGSWWKYLITDVTRGGRGNKERIAFLYDTRKVSFAGLAGEVVLQPVEEKGKYKEPSEQFYRTPYLAGFRASWFRFVICSVHIVYGTERANDPDRIREIGSITGFLKEEQAKKSSWAKNYVLLGDFNIFKPSDETFSKLTDAGFIVPQKSRVPTNINGDKYFDQIAFILEDPSYLNLTESPSGIFDYYKHVYRPEDEGIYAKEMGAKYKEKDKASRTAYYKKWRTFQMSDHLPKWIEIRIDFGEEYLKNKSKP